MNDKYWNDYTSFIKITEDLTKMSPADLINQYQEFVNDLREGYYGIGFEFDHDFHVRELIDMVIYDVDLQDNQLLNDFNIKVKELDIICKGFLAFDNDPRFWWKNATIDLEKIRKANC